ncbi:MAG: alpha/beta fold hydrolase [Polyangiaceae bacterium]
MRASTPKVELEYETFGRPGDPPVVLIAGFGQQLTSWDGHLCTEIAARGFHVVRFDNRDVGLSTKLESGVRPNIPAIVGGDLSTVTYSIEDMADDVAGLIESFGVGAAHVAGMSMGGMIAQSLAIRHPSQMKSLVSIMSTPGDKSVGYAAPETMQLIAKRAPVDRAENIEHGMHVWHALRSPGFPHDEAQGRERIGRAYDRSFYPAGVARQAAAIVSQSDRTAALGQVRLPAVVIHGAVDPLIHVSGGEATARAIVGAKLVIVPGMGHDLPEGMWPIVIDALGSIAR